MEHRLEGGIALCRKAVRPKFQPISLKPFPHCKEFQEKNMKDNKFIRGNEDREEEKYINTPAQERTQSPPDWRKVQGSFFKEG